MNEARRSDQPDPVDESGFEVEGVGEEGPEDEPRSRLGNDVPYDR